jgi:hypothetical protein
MMALRLDEVLVWRRYFYLARGAVFALLSLMLLCASKGVRTSTAPS